jgi:pimeloyl-ACP methyl ester carboxylesterase
MAIAQGRRRSWMTGAAAPERDMECDLPPPRMEGALELADGRRLGYAEYGPASGRPVLWFHGTPGARRQIPPQARHAAQQREVRIVAIERPGVGISTPHLYRRLLDWAGDIEEFASRLGLDRFGIVGLSGGGPYALACAHRLPDRVVATAVLGGVAPAVGADAASGGLVALLPRAAPLLALSRRPIGRSMRWFVRLLLPWADEATDLFLRVLPPGDRRVFADPAMRRMFVEDIVRGSRRQMEAMVLDGILFGRPWGFSLRDIRVPVRFWHGDADNIVPLSHGEHMAAHVPGSQLRVRPGEGHLGSLAAALDVLDAILCCWPEGPGRGAGRSMLG